MECYKRIEHSQHGNGRENGGRDLTDPVSEVEETNSETAEDDCEVEP